MKKFIRAGLTAILCAGLLSACGDKLNADTTTVYVDKKGKVTSVDVEKLDREYYDETELEEFIDKQIAEYNEDNGEKIEKKSFQVKDGEAKLTMSYDSFEDYSDFNGIEAYSGTIVKAQAEGYDFNQKFLKAPEKSGKERAEKVNKKEVIADDSNKVLIIKTNTDVKVDGKILFVSEKNASVTGKNTVSVTGNEAGEEAELTYIIYK